MCNVVATRENGSLFMKEKPIKGLLLQEKLDQDDLVNRKELSRSDFLVQISMKIVVNLHYC